MTLRIEQLPYFFWRLTRNILCIAPWTRGMLFPPQELAARFGPSNAKYAWNVFARHHERLKQSGYDGASRILEVGPGQNIGTSLLWYAIEKGKGNSPHVVLWDVFPNARTGSEAWRECARGLLGSIPAEMVLDENATTVLHAVAGGHLVPDIDYQVCPCSKLTETYHGQPFDLIYSQASLEHAWAIQEAWDALRHVTAPGGWHSHRIDLADHGHRETNYIEMLEWPEWAYHATMRYIPGAINRWRASQHIGYLKTLGFNILMEERKVQPHLPIARERLAEPFQRMGDLDLRTTAVDLVARLTA